MYEETREEKVRERFRATDQQVTQQVATALGFALLNRLEPCYSPLPDNMRLLNGALDVINTDIKRGRRSLKKLTHDKLLKSTRFICIECLKELDAQDGIFSAEDDYRQTDDLAVPTFYCLDCFDKTHEHINPEDYE